MYLQSLAAIAAVVDLAVIVSACAAGFLLARGTIVPGWMAAIAMLLIVRAIAMTTAHAMGPPYASGAFPFIDVAIGTLAACCLTLELRSSRARGTEATAVASATPMASAHATDTTAHAAEEHADAA